MRASGNAPVANHVDPVTDSVDDLGELVEGAARSIELTPPMIGHHDCSRADVHSTLCVRDGHDAPETELLAPILADILRVLPIHRLVEHCAEILSDRYRDVRTLLHIDLQLGQLERLVREMVDRPPR